MKNLLPLKPMLLVCAFFLLISQASYAQKTWDRGAGNDNWGDGNNWNPNGVPTSSDAVTIASNGTVIVNITNAVCASLQLGGTSGNTRATLTFASSGSPKLTVTNAVTVGGEGSTNSNRGGTITFVSGSTLHAGSIILTKSTSGDDAPGIITMVANSRLLTGSFAIGQGVGTWTPSTGTVVLTANNTLPSSTFTTFGNLIDSIGTTTLSTNLIVNESLSVSKGATLALSTFTLGSPTSLSLEDGAVTGSRITGSGVLTLGGNIAVTSAATGNDGAIISCPVALGATRTITVADDGTSATDLTMTGIISGSFGITKNGEGELHVSGANTYTGTTTVSAGKLKLGASSSSSASGPLGSTGAGTSVTSGAVLDLNGFSLTSAATEALTLNGTGISSGGALTNSSSTASNYIGLITIASSTSIITNAGDINLTNTGTFTSDSYVLTLGGTGNGQISGVFSANTNGITKIGAGTWTLSGTNTYAGPTLISAGTLKLGSTSALGSATGSVTVASGGALDLNGFSLSAVKTTSISGTGVNSLGAITNSSSTPATYSGAITLAANSSIVGETGSIAISNTGQLVGSGFTLTLGGTTGGSFSSILNTGSGGLTKIGTGTWTINAENFYNGATTISEGTLKLGIGGLLNTADRGPLGSNVAGTTVASGAALDLNGFSINNTSIPEALTLNGSGISNGGALTNTGGAATFKGAITLASASTITATTSGSLTCSGTVAGAFGLTLGGAGTGTMSGVISTPTSLTKDGAGTWTLSGTNTYTGTTTVSAGTLVLNNTSALGANTNSFVISTGAKADIITNETVGTMTLGGMGTANGTWGFTGSGATYIDATFFTNSASGRITVSTDSRSTPTVTPTVGTYTYNGSAQGPNTATNTGTGTSYTFSYAGSGGTSYGPSSTLPTNAGTYTVTVTVAANANYSAASSSATAFTIAQANLTITANNQTKCSGITSTFAGTEFTTIGLIGGNTVTSTTLSSTGSASSATAGTYPIVPTNAAGTGLANYTISYINGTLTVNASPDISNFSIGGVTNPAPGGTSTVTINSTSLANGTYTVTYNLAGNNTATGSTASVTVASGTGTFATSALATAGYTTITITAIKTAGNCSSTISSGNSATILILAEESETITNTATTTWTAPLGVTSVKVEVWGGGGRGGSTSNNSTETGGGGGGAYALDSSIAVTAGTTYNLNVADGSTSTSAGEDSWFNTTGTVLAKGGNSGATNSSTGATGGSSTNSIGDVKWAGGNGANGSDGNNGGGGGSSAGTSTFGASATNSAGATAPSGGGNGGGGRTGSSGNGTAGSAPGGGGGGVRSSSGDNRIGGAGARGQVKITYKKLTYKSQIISANLGSTNWCAGETRDVTVTIKNIGTATWTDGTGGTPTINIGVKWNTNASNWADYHVRTSANNLAPGETGTYTFTITASNNTGSAYTTALAAGNNNLTFDVVYEGISWFADNGGGVGPGNTKFTSPVQTINAVPSAPTGTSASRCGTGTVGLSASGTGTIKWYDASTGGTLLSSGNSYTTPSISSTTIYYATDSSVATGCTSTRTAVTATINTVPSAPTGTSAARCGTGTVSLSASGTGTIKWYDASTGGTLLGSGSSYTTPSISSTTIYYAMDSIAASGCISATRTAVTATVNAVPSAPTGTSAARCGTGTVDLSASGTGTIKWYNASTGGTLLSSGSSYTTPSISSTTIYYAMDSINAAGCTSTRTAVTATVNAVPSAPTGTSAARCGTGTVSLSASGTGTIKWYDASTGGTLLSSGNSYTTPSISSTTIYYATDSSVATGCTSTRTAVTATINTVPSAPTGTSAARCGTGTVSLSASGTGTIKWYDASTGGTLLGSGSSYTTPSISSTTIYYAMDSIAASGCISATRTAVTATVNAVPSAPTGTSAARCGTGTVSLSASGTGTIKWYNASTGGTLLGSGSSFTTPSISSTTIYYAMDSIVATGCVSATRDAVTATVNAVPSAPTGTSASRCGTGTVSLSASGTGTIKWYNASTGGTLLSSGNSYTTPSISSTTIYYATDSSVATGCTSTRTAVTATINTVPSAPTGTSAARCGTGTVSLSASGTGTIKWYNASTGGTLLGSGSSYTTPSISSTTIYYAMDSIVASGCTSATRTAVTATINAVPSAPTGTSAARCGTGTVSLSASGTGTIKWYNASTGGTLLSSGNSYTTPSISSTTIYYAMDSIVATGCISATRTAVTATVNAVPSAPTGTSASRCGTGTVSLSASGTGTIKWYNASTGGTLLSSGNSYTTPSISSTTIYYALDSINATGCTSTRTAITATVNTNVGISSATAASSSICSSATTTLTANDVVGTNAVVTWWTAAGGTGTNLGTGTTLTNRAPGTYFARVTGDCGTAVEASVTVSSKVNVGITSATAATSSICSSATTTLTANGVVGTNAVVTWYTGAGGTGTNLGTGTTLTNRGAGTYYARVTGDCGSAVEASITVSSLVNAGITSATAGAISVCSDATTTLTANGAVGTNAVVTWWTATGGTGTNLGTGTTITRGPGTYYARVTADCGSAVEASVTVGTLASPSVVLGSPTNSSICSGLSQVLSASATISSSSLTTLDSDNFTTPEFTTDGSNSGGGSIFSNQASPYVAGLTTITNNVDNSKFMIAVATAFGSATTNSRLISPTYNTTGYQSLNVTYYHSYNQVSGSAKVEVSTDGGTNWTTLKTYTSDEGGNSNFVKDSVDLNSYINQTNLKIRFNASISVTFNTAWWAIDNVELKGLKTNTPLFSWSANTAAGVNGLTANAQTYLEANSTTTVTPTSTTLYTLTAKDPSTHCTSSATSITVNVLANPTAPTGTGASSCTSGRLILNATVGVNETADWYSVSTGGTAITSGSEIFQTPIISATTIYYAAARNTVTGCVSSTRTAVTATINTVPSAPTGTDGARCGTGTVSLSASGTGTIKWYNASTGGTLLSIGNSYTTPSISSTTIYYALDSLSTGCVSATRTAVTATVNAVPSAPIGTSAARCGTGTVGLSATGTGTIKWYNASTAGTLLSSGNSYTTPSISSTTIYYAMDSIVATGCISATRTAVTATVNAVPSAPTGSSAARCGTGTVNLSASGTGTIKWYDASTAGTLLSSGNSYTTPSISSTTIYYAMDSIVATGCISATRTAVTATINTVPSAPTGTDGARCGTGTVSLSASGTGTIKWYNASTGGTLLSIGNSYTTPSISSTTIYYALDSLSTGCVSATRTAITATVNAVPSAPTGTDVARCGTGTVGLSASGTGTIKWYNASTGGTLLSSGNSYTTPSISTTTIYYAMDSIVASGCTSATRTAVTATVNAVPSAPTGTSAVRCGTGTVSLSASGTGTIKWYNASTGGILLSSGNSFTTPSISSTTIYYAMDSIVATGCISATRTAVTATVNAVPSAPTGTSAARCGTGTVSLSASGTGTIKWYDASTGGTLLSSGNSYTTPSISSTTIYYAMDSIVATGCISATRTAVTATVNAVPSAPTGTSAARCGTGTVSLSATGTGTIKWYNASTGGTLFSTGNSYTTPSISVTTIYYALDSINATGCKSSTRTAVTATINAVPSAPTGTSAARCGTGTVSLSATGTGTIKWYTASTGGTLLSSGNSYTTPSISSTTIYYALDSINATGCTSATRTAVTATINAVPSAPTGTSAARCGTGTVGLSATGTGTIKWYNASTGGTLLSSGNSYTTPSISTTTIYYVLDSINATGCKSDTRTAVTATVNAVPSAPTGTSASRCGAGTVELSASGTGTIKWYNASTGGTLLSSGNSYTTPSISSTTIYYALDSIETTGCKSTTRTAVVATINNLTTSNDDITNCTSYFWNGITYTTSGNYSYSTTNAAGCDSTATLNLTITLPSESDTSITNCDSYVWNGTTYSNSGTYTFTTTNSVGCDSVATLNLTINRSTSNTENITNCNTYTWNGTTYSNSGTYSFSTTNDVGCDSTAILNLTINRSSSPAPINITVCDEFTWNENTYTASGVYTYSTTNSVGCDSTATLNLTVKKSTTSTTVIEACDAYRWNNATYSASGIFTYTTTNSVGCDSVASLDLTIKYSTSFEFSASNCDNYLWNGVTYSASGTYSFTTTNAVGCDSVATLNLTILESTTSATTESACEQYEWNGVTYSNSGTYTYLSTNASGCSSTDTLHLTIKRATTSSTDEISCETFAWNGSVYSNTGTFTYNTTNSVGCDSVALLNLTILNGTNETIYAESCVNYFINDSLYTESGTYTQRLVNSVGCDSVLTIILTINQGTFTSNTVSNCDSYMWNNILYTRSGQFIVYYNNASGCLSADTLYLTIRNSSTSTTNISACNSYSWNGEEYTASGVYTYITTNADNCDSTATLNLTIETAPDLDPITGLTEVCRYVNTTYTNSTANGRWSSDDTTVLQIDSITGVATAVSAGVANITYTIRTALGCTNSTAIAVTVNASTLVSISGPGNVCVADSITLIGSEDGGTWSIDNASLASIESTTGILLGGVSGNVQITYTYTEPTSGCVSTGTYNVVVNALPSAPDSIIGLNELCQYVNTSDTIEYSVPLVSGISNYFWTLPVGATLVSGQNTSTIRVVFTDDLPRAGAKICVNSVSDAGCYSATQFLRIYKSIPYLFTLTGPNNACPLVGIDTVVYYTCNISATANYYDWVVPSGATIVSGQGTYQIGVKYDTSFRSGFVRVRGLSNCGVMSGTGKYLAITRSLPSAPGFINGPSNTCAYYNNGTEVTYSVADVVFATGYLWTLPNNVTLVSGQGTNTIVVRFEAGFVNSTLKVRALSNCASTLDRGINLTANPFTVPNSVSGPTNACMFVNTGNMATYVCSKSTGAPAYIWTVPAGVTIIERPGDLPENDTIIRVLFDENFVSATNIQVQTTGCNTSVARTITINKTAPAAPTSVTGITNVCNQIGSNNRVRYSTRRVLNATQYLWTVPNNAQIQSYDGDTAINVTFNSGYVTGMIEARTSNACAVSSARMLSVSRALPATPSNISGPTNSCAYYANGITATYSIPAVQDATGYAWTLPSYMTLVSGQNTTSITVKFDSGFVTSNIKVKSLNACAESLEKTLRVTATPYAAPGTISGPTNSCIYINDGIATYTIRKVANATGYLWTVPTGATIIDHPAGTGALDTIIKVTFTPDFLFGSLIRVQSMGCGLSNARTLAITGSVSTPPGNITGTSNVCEFMESPTNPNGIIATYRIRKVSSANAYAWTVPDEAEIVGHPGGLGVNDTAIMVKFEDEFIGGSIKVRSSNSCGSSAERSFTLTRTQPSKPGAISTTALGTCPNRSYRYSISSMPTNATSVEWTVPSGASIVSQTALSITVSYPSSAITGTVKAQSFNNCSSSDFRTLSVRYNACPNSLIGTTPVVTGRVEEAKVEVVKPLSLGVSVYPNPTTSSFSVKVKAVSTEKLHIKLMDMAGRMLKIYQTMPGEDLNFGNELKAGVYMIEVTQGNLKSVQRLMKF